MHDTDSFAQVPALDSIAEQPSPEELLFVFEKECEVSYKEASPSTISTVSCSAASNSGLGGCRLLSGVRS